jgi:hypothetical protein
VTVYDDPSLDIPSRLGFDQRSSPELLILVESEKPGAVVVIGGQRVE